MAVKSRCLIFLICAIFCLTVEAQGLNNVLNSVKYKLLNIEIQDKTKSPTGNTHTSINNVQGANNVPPRATSAQPAKSTQGGQPVVQTMPVCLSGDCQSGTGVLQSVDFRYEGTFKDGKFEGRGTFSYLSGERKGTIYRGEFSNNKFNGFGRLTYQVGGWFKYYEGNYVNGKKAGQGMLVSWNNDFFRGTFVNGQPGGFGVKTKDGFPRLGYYDDAQDIDGTIGLDLPILLHHLDTTFARKVLCDCLTPAKISIASMGFGNVNYDEVDVNTGEKVGDSHQMEVVTKDIVNQGFQNNTDHNIYIKAYRKYHYVTRNVDGYFDESFVVKPGQQTLGNYRSLPEGGTVLNMYFPQEIVYLGQYVDKGNDRNCKKAIQSNHKKN